jgi:hypothetical protein
MAQRHNRSFEVESGPISPELCLVDPELARAALARLPVDPDLEREVERALAPRVLRAPIPGRRRSRPARPVESTRRPVRTRSARRRAAPRVVAAALALVACIPFLPSTEVRGAVTAHWQSGAPATDQLGAAANDVLVVPDVCRLAYVFAKGRLQEAGFAWKLSGPIQGYAGNRVLRQIPAPGTAVVDTGAPTVALLLGHSEGYVVRGTPDNHAPYEGTTLEIAPVGDLRLSDVLERVTAAPVMNRCERGQTPAGATPHGL